VLLTSALETAGVLSKTLCTTFFFFFFFCSACESPAPSPAEDAASEAEAIESEAIEAEAGEAAT